MAENQILEAINGLKTSMTAMEQELRAAPTKTDFNSLVTEIRSVKENVIRNKDHIDTLYDLRKSDAEHLTKRVEKMIDNRIASSTNGAGNEMDGETGRDFLRCRQSIHLWPIQDSSGLEKGVKRFLTFYLKMPAEVIDTLVFVKITKQCQARRSNINDEVLAVLQTSQQRDAIQSFAPKGS